MLICIYNLTDDETFSLWDIFNLILCDFYGAIVTLIISDRLCFIGLTFYLYRLSEYRLKSHIGATLTDDSCNLPLLFSVADDGKILHYPSGFPRNNLQHCHLQ